MEEVVKIKSRIDEFDLVINIPEKSDKKFLVLACHGFDSNKESESVLRLKETAEKEGVMLARYTHPYHGERRNSPEDLTVNNCIEDMIKVEDELKSRFPNTKIAIVATSFGAYLALIRLKKQSNNFSSIILKAPAIKMDEILLNCLITDDFETFKKQGFSTRYRKETPMVVKYDFYEDLKNNRVFDLGRYDEKILIYHGIEDDTAPYEDTKLFAEQNSKVKLISLENEGHRFTFSKLDEVHEEIIQWIKNND